jgi:hypothetical protein
MKKLSWITIFTFIAYSCSPKPENSLAYPEHVGDISVDEKLDDSLFKVCTKGRIPQYYEFGKGLQYKGEKPAINEHFKSLKNSELKNETGFITIRFVVNCEGKTGRFRIQEMGDDYQPRTFDKKLVENILSLTKQLDGWVVGGDANHAIDYYQYLTFNVEEGKLIEIMP